MVLKDDCLKNGDHSKLSDFALILNLHQNRVIKGRVPTIRSKQRIGPMLGFKRFDTAAATISGTELAARIRKHQFTLGKVPGRPDHCAGNLGRCAGCVITNSGFLSASTLLSTLHQCPFFI